MTSFFSRPAVRSALAATVLAAGATVASAEAGTRVIERAPYESQLDGLTVAFLARDLQTGVDHVLAGSDLDSRHTPWSTFKIPNFLIAIETGAAPSPEAWRDWNPERRPAEAYWPEAWRQGQTLGTAFARSAAWYFQDLALEIGTETYREKLSDWGYGNADVPPDSDDFWLSGSLRISVREQVDFLAALVSDELDLSDRSRRALDAASLAGAAPGITLHGKTGSGPDDPDDVDGAFSGWYAGYLQREGRAPVVFALHVSAPSFTQLRDFRKSFSITLLEASGLVPRGALANR